MPAPSLDEFLDKWTKAEASERANAQSFLNELCDILQVPRPGTGDVGDYCFERVVPRVDAHGARLADGRADLYRADHFVLEAKQGAFKQSQKEREEEGRKKMGTAVRGTRAWDVAMDEARNQAEAYARVLGWPPFLVVVDVGHTIELFADFSRSGKAYQSFPDARTFRVQLGDLRRDEVRARLKAVWTDPRSLDPALRSAKVTRDVAEKLARIAKSLEEDGHTAEGVAQFLMRCIFTMFAEDVQLLPARSFTKKLEQWREHPEKLAPALEALWREMDKGGYSLVLDESLLRFNGGLFHSTHVYALKRMQIEALLEAAKADWCDVEPAIFGTLLERALDPAERHALGAHFTPRAYVERLVFPTVIEPLREEWEQTKVAAATLVMKGGKDAPKNVVKLVRTFHEKLCSTRVLDPACGTGNFLYVTLEHMKRLEGEVLDVLEGLGEQRRLALAGGSEPHTVDPQRFHGIEVNPRAAAIAELVLWIGYLQWHYRTFGAREWPEPVLRPFTNIEKRDAVLAWDGDPELVRDEKTGAPITRWDGRSMKKHPVTGEDVPDESKTEPTYRYKNPRKAEWPAAEYVVGNPPFIGNKRMRDALGDGYVEALREACGGEDGVPDSADYVMYWWDEAARRVRRGDLRRFGLITTNSITQTFNRGVVGRHVGGGMRIGFAVPDHPWVDEANGAAVRIAMTSGDLWQGPGLLAECVREGEPGSSGEVEVFFRHRRGQIHANLTVGANVAEVADLMANEGLSFMGVTLVGQGFVVDSGDELLEKEPAAFKRYLVGNELNKERKNRYVIDFFGMGADEARQRFPMSYQRVLERVKPERDQSTRATYRDNWWLHAEKRPAMRAALAGLTRNIAVCRTAKHFVFQFVGADTLLESTAIAIATDDGYALAVLSSTTHVRWCLATGGMLEDRPRYNSKIVFDPFPFPAATREQQARIRALGEQLDAHRKTQLTLHPRLTITGMYNVREKLRAGVALTAKDKEIHEQGLVSVLKQLHDQLDAAVLDAYGWPHDLTDEQLLERLVALNHERAAEERRGLVRWLRPDYQIPLFGDAKKGKAPSAEPDDGEDETGEDDVGEAKAAKKAKKKAAKPEKAPWPSSLPAQVSAVEAALREAARAATVDDIAARFSRAGKDDVAEILSTLVAFRRAEQPDLGCFVAV